MYTGRGVITSSLWPTPPVPTLGVDGVLEKLKTTLGTSYALDSVISILESYVAQNYDFGTVYAYLRPFWNDNDIATIEHKLRTREEEDMKMRRDMLNHDRITTRRVPPRRVWDLYANRVVSYWVADRHPWGISHAWVEEKDRMDVMTPINGYEWPVPMPKDADLDLIRIEMLNHGAKYACWIFCVCGRRVGRTSICAWMNGSWMCPTIGWVYWGTDVVCYFNGLGRPLNLTPDYFKSDRCWFRRAWTLQEITSARSLVGRLGKTIVEKEVRKMFDERLHDCERYDNGTWPLNSY